MKKNQTCAVILFVAMTCMILSVTTSAPLTKAESQNAPTSIATATDYERAYPHVFTRHGPAVKKIALTFDDGPDLVYTPKILDILKKEGVHASFFVLGMNAARYPAIIRRIVNDGHTLGNHSFDHINLALSHKEKIDWEVLATEQVLTRIVGKQPRWFRAPYGNVSPLVLTELHRMGYRAVNWSVDSNDWRSLPAHKVKDNILQNVAPGAIILQHSAAGGPNENLSGTVRALTDIIRTLKKNGYQLVTVPQLLTPDSRIVHAKPHTH